MTPTEFVRELSYPLRSSTTLLAIATFFLLSLIIVFAVSLVGVFALGALWLGLVIVVAVIRYLVLLAEARSDDIEVAPPGIEYFTLTDNAWTLFPAAIVLAVASLVDALMSAGQLQAAWLVVGLGVGLFPAIIGVLTLTRSMLESVNPVSIVRFILRLGPSYLYALAAAGLPVTVVLLADALPAWVAVLLILVSLASFFSVVGALTRTSGIVEEVGIAAAEEPDESELAFRTEKTRSAALSHAYGFASRGNRDGALGHIEEALALDPDPGDAQRWYFERMLNWEDSAPALKFAQLMLHRLLEDDDIVPAVKLMLRCQMLNPRFRPLAEDLQIAIQAADTCRNEELAESLRRL